MNILLKRWLLGVATATVAVVFLAPLPQRKALTDTKSNDGWLVPRLPITTTDSQSVVSGLLQSKLWGSAAETPAVVDDKASRWRIAGITGRPAERYAIIQFGDDRVQQLKAGDKLPDGTLISEVSERGICVLLAQKKRNLPLDGQAAAIVW
ncbi:MAG: hypothetical protein ACKO1K_02240 [Burkholderiales bacterium]